MYQKPEVIPVEDVVEGVYMASGAVGENLGNPNVNPGNDGGNTGGSGEVKCDSVWMQGVYQAPDYSLDGTSGYKAQYGCLGCPAFTWNACGLQTHYEDSGHASSYEVDNGNRKPGWEREGHLPEEPVKWNQVISRYWLSKSDLCPDA